MKRKWFAMLAVAALAIIILMPTEVAWAEECPDCKKEIEYPSVLVTASCLKEGYYEWDCDSCKKIFRTTIPALGHNKVHDPELDREWTCTEDGLHGWICTRCGDVSYGTILAPGHDWKAADCTHAKTCQRCGATEGYALGHDDVRAPELDIEWSCTENGGHAWQCSRCGNVGYGTILAPGHNWKAADCTHAKTCQRTGCGATEGSALGHTPVADTAVPATCIAAGLTEGSHCAVCSTVLTAQTVAPALGHTPVTDAAVPATCTATGLTGGSHCSVCNTILTAQTVAPALGHMPVIAAAVQATCTSAGLTEGSHCSVCNTILIIQQSIPANGHSFTRYVSNSDATCTANGTKTAACDNCDATDTIIDAGSKLGHDYRSVHTKPTCTKGGHTTYTCSRCSDRYTADKTAQLGHRFGEWMNSGGGSHSATCLRSGCSYTNKADCKTFSRLYNGMKFTICSVCGETPTGERLALMTDAKALAVTNALPRGELVLRRGTLADGTQVVAVSFEYAGELEQPKGIVRITLPASAFEGYTLLLQNADGTETVLACSEGDGLLYFELDFTPVQGANPVSVALLRLVPI